jgi:hypothetical protein
VWFELVVLSWFDDINIRDVAFVPNPKSQTQTKKKPRNSKSCGAIYYVKRY